MQIIVLPGLDGSAILLKDFCREFGDHNIHVIDYPTDVAAYDDLLTVVKTRLPVEENYIVIAESFSGPIAIQLASRKPAGLLGVVFVATFASAPRTMPGVVVALLNLLPIKSSLLTWAAQPILMGRWRSSCFTQKFRAALIKLPHSVLVNRVRDVLQVDVTDLLTGLEIPSLYLRPNQDRLVPSSVSQPFSTLHSLEGPHFILQARPVESAEIVQEFLDQM